MKVFYKPRHHKKNIVKEDHEELDFLGFMIFIPYILIVISLIKYIFTG